MGQLFRWRIRRSLAFAIVAALAFASGSALVALGDPAPVTFYACLSPGGALPNVNTSSPARCGRGSQQVSWNQMGPVGPKGDQGPSGLSQAYAAVNNDTVDLSSSPTAVVTLANLPAGKYIVNAVETAVSGHGDTDFHGVSCHPSGGKVWAVQNQSQRGYTNVSVAEAMTLANAGDLSLLCTGSVSDDQSKIQSYTASITAIAVDSIN